MPRYNLRIGSRTVPVAESDTALSKAIGKRLAAGDPTTNVDSTGGGHRHSFGGQEITFEDLRDIKDIRDSGGQVAQLMSYKALLNFGEGVEVHVEDDEETEQVVDGDPMTLTEWLETEAFPTLDLLVLDLGEDALWYPAAYGELRETRGGGFAEALPAEPWTILPNTDAKGEVVNYVQRTKTPGGGYAEEPLDPDDLWSIVLNKASARDKTGISEVLRNEDEIRAFKENEQAINQAIELHGFPQRHVKVGREEGAPVSDDDLRRVRTIFDPRSTDANTAYFTGQDVSVETLEAHQFDYTAIHEMDMRNLTTALGLPLEAGNVGSDGLGSGKPAELRFAMLKLAIQANQRSFGVQFVENVMRPVIRDYSPYDHTATITLDIGDPLEDIGDMADVIQQIGEYMTTDEIRRKLDMPEPEDEEIGESYRSPADVEAPDDQGGPFGGGDGLFRDAADGRTLQEVPDNAVSISDRSEAPEGANVIQGPGGGLYYVPGGEGDGDGGGTSKVDGPEDIPPEGFTDDELEGVIDDVTPDAESVDAGDVAPDNVAAMGDALPTEVGESKWWDRQTPADDAPEKGDVVSVRDGGEQTPAVVLDQDGVPDGGVRVMTPNGEETVSLRRGVTHTLDKEAEVDAPEDAASVEARDPSEAAETVSADEFGFEGGRNVDQMKVHTYDDGSFTVETDFSGREEFGERATAASDIINELGGSSPEHRFEGDSLLVGGVDGSELGDVNAEEIDTESLTDTLAAAAITGDGDLNRDSFIVDESGSVHAIDLEMASFGNMGPDNALTNIENMAESLDLPVEISEIEDRMGEMASNTSRNDLIDATDQEDMAIDISANLSGIQNRALGEGVTDRDLANAPEWDRPLLEMYRGVSDPESDPDRALVDFAASGTPEFVLERIREAVMSGAMFSSFDGIDDGRLMDFRQEFADAVGTDNFTLDSITESVMDFADMPRDEAERIARTESSAVLNKAREEGYEARGEGDELFYWTGAEPGDDRQTDACEWLIEETNPHHGGRPRPMKELRQMVGEAWTHDENMDTNMARPDSWVVHINERSTFAKAPPNWVQL